MMYMAGKITLTDGTTTFDAQVYVEKERVTAQANSTEYVKLTPLGDSRHIYVGVDGEEYTVTREF